MKIVIATCGSRGDVQPILALAVALRDAGHDILLAAPPDFAAWVESYDCRFRPLGSKVEPILEQCPNAHTLRPAIIFLHFVRQELKIQFRELPDIVAGADLVIGASLAFGLHTIAQHQGIPYVFIALTPQLFPSGHHPFLAFRNHRMPRCLNRLSWNFSNFMDNINTKALINRERRRLGLKPIREAWGHILGSHVILATDRILGTVPPDVEQTYFQTGYFHLGQKEELDRDVEAFLDAGPPPLHVGFGSMPSRDLQALTPLVLDAVRSVGHRVIVSCRRFNGGRLVSDRNCFFIQNSPHHALFPRMAAVVHHGGAGTTATAARAGVPQIIVPHILDQYYWANRIHHAGVGPEPVWRSRLTRKRLAKAVEECLSSETMRRRAKEISALIQSHNSLGVAVKAIESAFPS
jgi:UDP:flavonoid glycosyltransferase YjiC (YdhE family)